MNILELIKISIKTLKSQKVVFTILAVVQIACVLTLFYIYSISNLFIDISMKRNQYNLCYDNGVEISSITPKIAELGKQYDIDNTFYYLDSDCSMVVSDGAHYNTQVRLGKNIDNSSAEKSIVFNAGVAEELGIALGDTFDFYGQDLKVIGISVGKTEISYSAITPQTVVYEVAINNGNLRTTNSRNKFANAVEKTFGKKLYSEDVDTSSLANGAMVYMVAVAIVAMCLVSFCIAIKSIQQKREKCYRVFKIIGLSKLRTYLLMLLEIAVICIAIFMVSSAIFAVINTYVLKSIADNSLYIIGFSEYCLLGLIYTAVVGVIASIVSTKELYKGSWKND